jgi:uncharacterized protein YndB with AHSA1/START domain
MKPIEKKVVINAPVSEVWQALTDPGKIEQWMLMPNNFKPELDHKFAFKGEMDGNTFDIKCRVLEIDENKKLVYSWSAPFFEGDTTVSIQLRDENGQTELLLTHSGWGEGQEEVKEKHSTGWDLRFVEKLKETVEKK